MGRVEYGAFQEDEFWVPYISITVKDGDGKLSDIKFVCNRKTKHKDQVDALLTTAFMILSGQAGMEDLEHHAEGKTVDEPKDS